MEEGDSGIDVQGCSARGSAVLNDVGIRLTGSGVSRESDEGLDGAVGALLEVNVRGIDRRQVGHGGGACERCSLIVVQVHLNII